MVPENVPENNKIKVGDFFPILEKKNQRYFP